ncbi:hypothetical protein [Nostoc sp. CCY0012]|uniref:hypothetical protein n=1 Tax=Nostoc sp. CCY0012 TaxID=1056123 RepID=UPI0039C5C91B
MKNLIDLITDVQSLIEQISEHPDYKALIEKGFTPDANLGDAKTAFTSLQWEVHDHE